MRRLDINKTTRKIAGSFNRADHGQGNYSTQAELRTGAGDALSKAFEMVATPAVFGVGGWYLDGWLNTRPLATIVAVVLVFTYQMWCFARDYTINLNKALDERRSGYADPSTSLTRNRPSKPCHAESPITTAAEQLYHD
ncbi:MAG: AtpZ/AtpI family protein [Acidimicrobiaceae bacterium]|nr:AtpZ/AtpI family protein [Acidimicrobiaceae bacterium]